MTRESLSQLNPFRVSGTILPPNLLLAAKLLVFSLLWRDYVSALPETWLPLWPALDQLPPAAVQTGLKATFFVGMLALMSNRFVRTGALLCGVPFLLESVIDRTAFYYSNFFCGCFLVLVGLYRGRWSLRLLHGQFVVMYFGSGLNKLLDGDWRSGHFLDHWMTEIVTANRYPAIAALLPDGVFGWFMSWNVILIEFALAALFLGASWRPSWVRPAIWLAISMHVGSVLLIRSDFGIFVLALLFSYLAFVPWPGRGGATMSIGSRGIGPVLRSFSRWIDFDRTLRWEQRAEDAPMRLELPILGRAYEGLAALNVWLLLHPTWYVVFALVISPQIYSKTVHKRVLDVVFILGVLWFFPLTLGFFRRLIEGRRRRSAGV